VFGLRGLAAHLDDRLAVLTRGAVRRCHGNKLCARQSIGAMSYFPRRKGTCCAGWGSFRRASGWRPRRLSSVTAMMPSPLSERRRKPCHHVPRDPGWIPSGSMAAARDDPGPPRELATLDKRLSFPVTREDSPKARIKSRCNIAHGRHTPIGDGDITRQQRDRTYSMVQHPAKCEPGIGGFRFFQTYGLSGITLQTRPRCCEECSIHAIKPAGIFATPSSSTFWRGDWSGLDNSMRRSSRSRRPWRPPNTVASATLFPNSFASNDRHTNLLGLPRRAQAEVFNPQGERFAAERLCPEPDRSAPRRPLQRPIERWRQPWRQAKAVAEAVSQPDHPFARSSTRRVE
jgi:hypothetical protein